MNFLRIAWTVKHCLNHILRPDGQTETVFLSDMGDGVYAGDYTNPALLGSYLITVEINGTTSKINGNNQGR